MLWLRSAALNTLLSVCWMPAPLSGQAQVPYDDNIPTFGTTVVIPSGLRGEIYNLPEGTSFLPNLDKMQPVGVIYTNSLNIPTRDFRAGFPGISHRIEWFAIDYKGRIWIDTPGKYYFALTSDDGSRLYIDDVMIINNDGVHAAETQTGKVTLTGGVHRIRVSYFQGPGFEVALVLSVTGPGRKWKIFNVKDFAPPPNAEEWQYGDAKDLKPATAGKPGERKLAEVYVTDTPEPPMATPAYEKEAVKLLKSKPWPTAFDFRVGAYRLRGEAQNSRLALAYELPIAGLTAAPADSKQIHKLRFSLLTLVKDEHGKIVDRFSLDSPYEIPAPKLDTVRGTTTFFSHGADLPAGHYTIETAVQDFEGKRWSASETSIEAPVARQTIDISSMLLVQRVDQVKSQGGVADPFVVQGKRVVPLIEKTVKAKTQPMLFFLVYPDMGNLEMPVMEIEFLNGGDSLAKQRAQLPPADNSGVVAMLLQAAQLPGECEMRVTVSQGKESAKQSIKYTVAPPQ